MSSSWNPQRQMPNYCGDCFAYFPLASLAQHEMMVFHKLLTSARTGRGWMHLFDGATKFSFLGGLRAYLHSHPTNTNRHDMVCADYGLNSARACHLRCTNLHPVCKVMVSISLTEILELLENRIMRQSRSYYCIWKDLLLESSGLCLHCHC